MAGFFTFRGFTDHCTALGMEDTFGVFLDVIFIPKDPENALKLPFKSLIASGKD